MWAYKLDKWIESNPYMRLLAIFAGLVGFIVVLATAYQIWVDLEERKDERKFRQLSFISLNWETLLRRAGGNTGKGAAINLLTSSGIGLDLLDLSCEKRGDLVQGQCSARPVYSGITLVETKPQAPKFVQGINFNETDILDFTIENYRFSGINFEKTSGLNWKVDSSVFGKGHFGSFTCNFCAFTKTDVPYEMYYGFNSTEISGIFVRSPIVKDDVFQKNRENTTKIKRSSEPNNWAYISNPPVFISKTTVFNYKYFTKRNTDFGEYLNYGEYLNIYLCWKSEISPEFITETPIQLQKNLFCVKGLPAVVEKIIPEILNNVEESEIRNFGPFFESMSKKFDIVPSESK
tara:strand:+ start:67 stop:1110 length:1044 start_codon:yes stop_codon:yes gene_type:complete